MEDPRKRKQGSADSHEFLFPPGTNPHGGVIPKNGERLAQRSPVCFFISQLTDHHFPRVVDAGRVRNGMSRETTLPGAIASRLQAC